tara:strand:- start:1605 stop:1823 length:219 start_codon:yes stop_codon:yes gene_type:complete
MEKKELGQLHEALAMLLLDRIASGEASSGDLSVARQFLKDNGIDANINQSKPLLNLAKVLPFDPEEPVEDVG